VRSVSVFGLSTEVQRTHDEEQQDHGECWRKEAGNHRGEEGSVPEGDERLGFKE